MFASGLQVVNILFNGYNTNKLSWFSLNNVITSSWTDFPSSLNSNVVLDALLALKEMSGKKPAL